MCRLGGAAPDVLGAAAPGVMAGSSERRIAVDTENMRDIGTSAIHLQRGNESFLRNVDLAELPHLLLAFLLLLQKLAFARDVATVAFCGDVLAYRAHGFARDHLAADRCLDRDLEQ